MAQTSTAMTVNMGLPSKGNAGPMAESGPIWQKQWQNALGKTVKTCINLGG